MVFEDNQLVKSLLGEYDQNLRHIEKALPVTLHAQGNTLSIHGREEDITLARRLLQELYFLIESNHPVHPQEIDFALKVLRGNRTVHLKDVFLDAIHVSPKQKLISPKSLVQKQYIDAIRRYDSVIGIGPAGTGKTYRAMASRFDLVLYGGTGFVGRRAAAYLAQQKLRRKLRWALAGRDAARVAALRDGPDADTAWVTLPAAIVADCHDIAAVEAMAASTRVLISTAGPFAVYGDAIVDACVHRRTHYADITGETAWVRRVIDRLHARAARDGTRIVPFCGFDSVPSDLGTLLVVRHIEEALGAACVEVNGYFRMMGGFNGGTLASNAHRYETVARWRAGATRSCSIRARGIAP